MIKIQNNEIEVLDPKMQGEGAEAKNGTLVKKFGKKRNTGSGMKRSTRFEKIYLGIIFFLMYLPVAVVIIFSFNESKLACPSHRIFPPVVRKAFRRQRHDGSSW